MEQYMSRLRGHRDDRGHAQVVRNGHGRERTAARDGRGAAALREQDPAAEHWQPLRTTHPIESTFAMVKPASPRYQGCGLTRRRPRDGLHLVAIHDS
jgi:hypothetical protein